VLTLALVALSGSGCGRDEGVVEVYWQFEDATLERVYPLGYRATSCGFTDRSGIEFDLRIQLTIVHYTDECAADHTDPACQLVEPRLFDCERARGTITGVPPSSEDASATNSDPGYLMLVEPVIVPASGDSFVPTSTCIGRPGPRVRRVRPGHISDLEVHQFILHALDPSAEAGMKLIDLEACRPIEGGGDDTGTDTGTDSGTETGTDTGTDSGTETGTDTSTDTSSTSETDTGTDTGSTT
jgi:hypothetical protein